ncbi:MAG: LamG domain-containing protein, partial [Planctomycetes bacterium]|nr:LamG domain-containing protein [Planctomycetota bacterium]
MINLTCWLCLPVAVALVAFAGLGEVLGQSGLLFYASFDNWPLADLAAGSRAPLKNMGGRIATGRVGGCLALDGNSYLEFAPKGNIGGTACTISLWFRPRDWGAKKYDNILGLSADNVNAFHLERSHPGGQLRLVLGGPDTADGAKTRSLFSREPLENDRWVHIAACWDAAAPRVELFVDGKSVAKNTQPGPTPLNVPVFLVGAGFGRLGRAIKGDIDE